MTRLARRATLLVALYLLASAATAHAECAWVLWGQTRDNRYLPSRSADRRERRTRCRSG